MLKSHERFHSTNGRRRILVADDEQVNRMILGNLLEKDYEVLFAGDGRETLELIRAHQGTLSLVLLDLQMPVMSGMEVLAALRQDPALESIPVIVITSDQSAEVESLALGAIDFISKPFPQPGVILARVLRTIELFEDRKIIQSTERDPLTGLYNREYFYRYAEQYDQYHRDQPMDALIVDINHFHIINERYGKAHGDRLLRGISERLRAQVSEIGGIVCRREADTFMIYCPHLDDYRPILEGAAADLAAEDGAGRVRLRMGVYPNADKSIDIERRFDRAKSASDTVRNSFSRTIGIYDSALHEAEFYAEQLIDDFRDAIREEQFTVFYQPKFDIRPEIPVLASAEALVRWKHPRLGMISPGVFIPLFEENGLIQELDHYVWRRSAAQVRQWRDRFGITIPVSVNVSRIDMYDSNLIGTFTGLLEEYGLRPRDLLLEITESAYTEDSAQIIATVTQLRELGFSIEMDDFGTGYSSLNMISSLPIDALKLDMQFIRNAFRDGRDTRLIEVIIDIAEYLGVPVIAEGVETAEQLSALRAMGCDIVQGYYFSRPVSPEEYEPFLIARRAQDASEPQSPEPASLEAADRASAYSSIAQALTSGYERIYYVDADSGFYVQFSAAGRDEDLQIERSGADFFADALCEAQRVVVPEDRARVCLSLQREALLAQLLGGGHFSMTYRRAAEGAPVYYNLRAVDARSRGGRHIVIGVSDVQEQLNQALGAETSADMSRVFLGVAEALSSDFDCIYYVDVETHRFSALTARGASVKPEGESSDFFAECRTRLAEIVHPDDRARVTAALSRDALLESLSGGDPFVLVCRLMVDGKAMDYRLRAVRAEGDPRHIIIGVSNIAQQMQRQREYEAAKAETVTFSSIAQALAADYFSIYYVDTDTDRFVEYTSHDEYRALRIEKSGEDFFNLSRRNILRVVYPADHEKVLTAFTKERLMAELARTGTFTLTYRLMFDGQPTFVNLKASRMADDTDSHIVIGVSNVDAQMRRERELSEAREKANRDALTGVKSKHAFVEAEAEMDARIASGDCQSFAIAFCDVNGLKQINDTQGHQAGDQLIREASSSICDIFKHSPVYRIGGDEFVAILRGQDYVRRDALAAEMARRNEQVGPDGVIIAVGMSDYRPGEDARFAEVFQRADARMYENKRLLKGADA